MDCEGFKELTYKKEGYRDIGKPNSVDCQQLKRTDDFILAAYIYAA
jgi:hypothetical protein